MRIIICKLVIIVWNLNYVILSICRVWGKIIMVDCFINNLLIYKN